MTQIILTLFLILYSNLIVYNTLKLTKQIETLRQFFMFDNYSMIYINITMLVLSALLMTINHMI